jgi:hypothetical protein
MQDIVYPIGDLLQWTFEFMPLLGNLPNILVILGGFVGLFIWIKMQSDYNKKPEKDGYIK